MRFFKNLMKKLSIRLTAFQAYMDTYSMYRQAGFDDKKAAERARSIYKLAINVQTALQAPKKPNQLKGK